MIISLKHIRRFALLVIMGCGLAAVVALARTSTTDVANENEITRLIAKDLPRMHMTHKPCDDELAENALNIFLDTLDYDHCYFLASDIVAFKSHADELDDRLKKGDIELAYHIYGVLQDRVSNRVNYVETLIDNGFDFTKEESYRWKRKDEPWPADEDEWNALWRKKIKNQYLTQLIGKKLADTNSVEEVDEDVAPTPDLTPEESVKKAYQQYFMLLNDNDLDWVLEQYLTAFARAYDPHTDYMSASNTEDFDIGMKLSLVGIGAMLTTEDGAAKIVRLIAGGPAEKDGRLKPGDKIIAVAQGDEKAVDILHWPLRKTVRLIRGKKGTKVVLTVIRASDPTGGTIDRIDLIREKVKLEEQAAKSEVREIKDEAGITHKLGIITLPEFYADMHGKRENGKEPRSSSRDVKRLLKDLKKQNVEGVVLDLRNNGGGLLTEAVEMTGLFIDSGPVVQVYNRRNTRILTDDDPDIIYGGPLVVLVSRQTASASEILAGALQDYGRAVVVGDSKTHGKGTVQTLANLRRDKPALGTLKVTTATFYRIAGGSTQLRGVKSDITMPSALDSMEVGEEFLPHAMPWTKVYPALYRMNPGVVEYLPELKARSETRRKSDPRYQAYLDLINRLSERQKEDEISLNMDKRLELAKQEKRLQKLLDEATAVPDEEKTDTDNTAENKKKKDEEKDASHDIVMTEALSILSDLIDLQHETPVKKLIAVKEPIPVDMN